MENVKNTVELYRRKLNLWKTKDIFHDNYYYSTSKPWDKRHHLYKEDVDQCVKMTYSNMLYIDTRNLKPRIQNQIRRLAAFRNKKFFKNKAMGLFVKGMSSWVECAEDKDYWLCLPRGCTSTLQKLFDESHIDYDIEDFRNCKKAIDVAFTGQLYDNQQAASTTLLEHDIGICHATTAFGKTIVGTYLIAQRKVNTLIIVHTNLIMNNWEDDLNRFWIFMRICQHI